MYPPPPPPPPPPRYGCLRCWIVLVHDRIEKGIRCPRCGRKLILLRDDLTVANMWNLVSGIILLWGNLIVIAMEAIFLKRMAETIGMVAFTFLCILGSYFLFRAARLFRLAWGKSFMDKTIPARRMVTMPYLQAVDNIKRGLPVDMSMTTIAPPMMPMLGPPPPMHP